MGLRVVPAHYRQIRTTLALTLSFVVEKADECILPAGQQSFTDKALRKWLGTFSHVCLMKLASYFTKPVSKCGAKTLCWVLMNPGAAQPTSS